jgi:hypothetical protein
LLGLLAGRAAKGFGEAKPETKHENHFDFSVINIQSFDSNPLCTNVIRCLRGSSMCVASESTSSFLLFGRFQLARFFLLRSPFSCCLAFRSSPNEALPGLHRTFNAFFFAPLQLLGCCWPEPGCLVEIISTHTSESLFIRKQQKRPKTGSDEEATMVKTSGRAHCLGQWTSKLVSRGLEQIQKSPEMRTALIATGSHAR